MADIEIHPDDGSGMLTVRSSKTDQEGRGELRYLGKPTVAAVTRWLLAAGLAAGALFRPLRPAPGGGHRAVPARLGAASVRAVIGRRAQAVDGITGRVSGHSLRVGSAQSPPPAPGSPICSRQAGGVPRTPRRSTCAPVARRRYGVGQ